MKMMVVGGNRSREYAEHIQSQFSIATEVIPGVSLEDIERAAVLGNLMERVLVLEQAWTIDGVSTDEREIRKRIGKMTKQARDRDGHEQYVFMARDRASAQLLYEETYDICERAVIVYYPQSVTVVILHELLANDIAGLRPSLVYIPPVTETEEPYTVEVDTERINDPIGFEQEQNQNKRVIKKNRGAAIQRAAGSNPWYEQSQKIGGRQMNGNMFGGGSNFNVGNMFAPQKPTQGDRGFADESPLTPGGAVDMSGQLRNMFKTGESVFAPKLAQPVATIPVAPVQPVANDLASFIRQNARRGYTISFIGPGGSGSTFMALNCAARIYSAGFSVMFIDGDLTGHSAQYLTRLGITNDDVFSAETNVRTLRAGFNMYSASQFLAGDGRSWAVPVEIAKDYDFIIADIPFHSLVQATAFVVNSARIAITVDSSNWGIGKAAMALFNSPVNVSPIIRERGRLIYNRSDKLSSGLFGVQVRDAEGIKERIEEVLGARATAFTQLPVAAVVGSYASAEEYWFSERLFSDSVEGAQVFDSVLLGLLG